MASAAPAPPAAPAELAAPLGNEAFLVAPAKGVQIYRCDKNTDSATSATTPFKWTFDHPEATLTGDNGQIITHDAGPIWKAPDGSSVTGSDAVRFPKDFDAATAKDIQAASTDGNAIRYGRPRRNDVHPAAQHPGRDPASRRRVQGANPRQGEGGPLQGGLRLL